MSANGPSRTPGVECRVVVGERGERYFTVDAGNGPNRTMRCDFLLHELVWALIEATPPEHLLAVVRTLFGPTRRRLDTSGLPEVVATVEEPVTDAEAFGVLQRFLDLYADPMHELRSGRPVGTFRGLMEEVHVAALADAEVMRRLLRPGEPPPDWA